MLVRGGIAEGRCIYLGNDSHLALCGQALHVGDSDVEHCVCVSEKASEREGGRERERRPHGAH